MTLSKHVPHYGPRSGFSHYSLTTPYGEDSIYPPPGDALTTSVRCVMATLTSSQHQTVCNTYIFLELIETLHDRFLS